MSDLLHAAEVLARIEAALRLVLIPPRCAEARMHEAIDAALHRAGIRAMREYSLAPGCRIDFWCEAGIGIECKVGKPSRAAVAAQIQRYAATGKVTGIVLCMQRMVLPVDPGIPYRFVSLNCNHGVAL